MVTKQIYESRQQQKLTVVTNFNGSHYNYKFDDVDDPDLHNILMWATLLFVSFMFQVSLLILLRKVRHPCARSWSTKRSAAEQLDKKVLIFIVGGDAVC